MSFWKSLIIIVIGISLIPALFCLVAGALATLMALLMSPRIMVTILIILGLICAPGIIIGWIARK